MKIWLFAYGGALLAVALLDGAWLGFLAIDFYRREMAEVIAPQFKLAPAVLFYLAYPAALVALAVQPRPDSLAAVVLRAALVGALAYGTYDLTNMATLRSWSLRLVLVDVAWGIFISSVAGAAAWWAASRA